MASAKTIEFGYEGGSHVQGYNVNRQNLPVSASCSDEWLRVSAGPSSAVIETDRNPGFKDREAVVTLSDRVGNTISMTVVQHGFTDLRVECPEHVAVPYTHYTENQSCDVYITSYGGSCGVKVSGMPKDVDNVWNISGTYRDYILHIPEGKSGTITITHSDIKSYKEWCKSVGIPFDESKLKRKLVIEQVSEEDMRGRITLSGVSGADFGYTTGVKYGSDTVIDIQECRYVRVSDTGTAEAVSESALHVSDVPEWLSCSAGEGRIVLSPLRLNPFENERRARLKVASPSNPRLYVILEAVQEPSTVKG